MNTHFCVSITIKPRLMALCVTVLAGAAIAQGTTHAGVWRYKDRGVWVQVNAEGNAYQCRIDKDETTTYTSRGRIEGNKISWEAIWGENDFEVSGESLILITSGRRLEFSRVNRPMDAVCKSPLQR